MAENDILYMQLDPEAVLTSVDSWLIFLKREFERLP